jgi:hypothetical protein
MLHYTVDLLTPRPPQEVPSLIASSAVARWEEIEAEAPELAKRGREIFDANQHKLLATIRRDGSPRICGSECLFVEGDLWFGSMPQAMKALDLLRDPRFSFHSSSGDPSVWKGDARVSGTVEEITDQKTKKKVLTRAPPGPNHLFRADITELVVVMLSPDQTGLLIEAWHEGVGVRSWTR